MPIRVAANDEQEEHGLRLNVDRYFSALKAAKNANGVALDYKSDAWLMQEILADMRFLDFSPARMRRSAFPGQIVLGDHGDNLPTVLKHICAEDERRLLLLEWTRELTSMDVEGFEFPVEPTTGRVQLALREAGGRTVSSCAASDGTLRFLAMAAALMAAEYLALTTAADSDCAGLYVFEEIESCVHPSRLGLLADLLES